MPRVGASPPSIWANAPAPAGPVNGPVAPPGLNPAVIVEATRAMCAAARHDTVVCAYPINQTKPGIKIVPVSELRRVLLNHKDGRRRLVSQMSDTELLDSFVAAATYKDAKGHGGVWRFRHATLDPLTMRPADQRSILSMQILDEPCLAIRLNRCW